MISRLLSKAQQLKGRSSHELYSRIAQRAYAWSERAALRFGSASVSHPELNSQTFAQPFFVGISDVSATLAVLRQVAPADESEVLARAAAIEHGDVPLMGYGLVHLGPSPEWQRDPFAKLSAPVRHWSTIPYLDPTIVGDHKVIWEINRHQYFVTLGQAWSYSRDERWPTAFVRYLQSWFDGNPATVGMNWASSLEVSYRAISWIWAMQLMRDASVVDATFQAKALRSLQDHGRHLERYLSTYFSPNTHLTGEALGLFYIGTQCPELPQAKRWRDLGAQVLEANIEKQVLPDGVYFEQATLYHRYTIDIYLQYLLLARAANCPVSNRVEGALHRLFDVLLHITRGDGSIPLIGDDDGGRLVQLDNRLPHDVRSLLGTGAVVLNRSDLAWMGRGDDAAMCWMLGAASVATRDALIDAPPEKHARAFPDGGIFVMRDGWGVSDGHLTVDAGPHGALSFGHSHADALSVELAIGGRPLFVDAGTFTYVGEERNAFRATSAHNTVEIDATSTSVPGSAFRWQSVSHPSLSTWTDEPEFSYFTGEHTAYAKLTVPLVHKRGVLHPAAGIWIIRDELTSAGRHDAVLRWHCAPGIEAIHAVTEADCSALRLTEGNSERAVLVTFGGSAGAMHVESSWVSRQFGHKSPASLCAWREVTSGNVVLTSIVIDAARYEVSWDATARFRQQVLGAVGVLALREQRAGLAEYTLVVLGGDKPISFLDLTINADIACIQLDAVTGKPLSMTAVGVTNAINNGVTFVRPDVGKQWVFVSNANAGAAGSWRLRSGAMLPPSVHASSGHHRSRSVPSTV